MSQTIRVVYSFTVDDDADSEEFAETLFDWLCDQDDDVPYESCDGWDPDGWSLRPDDEMLRAEAERAMGDS